MRSELMMFIGLIALLGLGMGYYTLLRIRSEIAVAFSALTLIAVLHVCGYTCGLQTGCWVFCGLAAAGLLLFLIKGQDRAGFFSPGMAALVVLFGTALLGDHFLTARENEKTFAVYFICGASTGKAVLLQSAVNFAETLLPYLISLAAAFIIPIRLYPLSAIGILLILLAGSALLSLVQMIRLRRESPSQIIARRFRG